MFSLIFIVSLFSRLRFAENYSDTNQIFMQSPDDSGPKVGSGARQLLRLPLSARASLAHHQHITCINLPAYVNRWISLSLKQTTRLADVSEVHLFTMSWPSTLRLAQQLSRRMTGAFKTLFEKWASSRSCARVLDIAQLSGVATNCS